MLSLYPSCFIPVKMFFYHLLKSTCYAAFHRAEIFVEIDTEFLVEIPNTELSVRHVDAIVCDPGHLSL